MTPRSPTGQRVSRGGLELIKSFEGYRRRAARLPGGSYVVGYGHVRSARAGAEVSEADAHALLVYDLMQIEGAVAEWSFAPLTQNQFDALVSFAFNIGLKEFRKSSVLRRINEGAMLQAAAELELWRQVDLNGEAVIVDALVRRRAAEKALFLTPLSGHVPAPTSILKPKLDLTMRLWSGRTEELFVPLDGDVTTVSREEPAPIVVEPVAATAEELGLSAAQDALREPDPQAELQFDAEPSPETEPELAPEREAEPEVQSSPILSSEVTDAGDEAEAEDDADWSAARAAVAAVSARLHKILQEDTEDEDGEDEAEILPAPPSPPEDTDEPDEAEESGDFLPEIEPFPVARLTRASEVSSGDTLASFPGALSALSALSNDVADEPAPLDPAVFQPQAANDEIEPEGPYLLLGLVGLLFIIAALVSLFRSPAPGESVGGISAVSWILGTLGIACVAGALWFTLGREENEQQD